MLFINGMSDYMLRYNGSGIHTPSSQMNLKAANSGHSSGWEVPGPCLTSEKHPKGWQCGLSSGFKDLEQDESKEKRDYGLVEVNQSSDISKGINKPANSLGQE